MPEQAMVRRALERAELVVVQEAFAATETTAYADWLLPASTWGEKLGTVTNSEQRISRVRAAVVAPGAARHDWQIGVQLAQRLESICGPRCQACFPTLRMPTRVPKPSGTSIASPHMGAIWISRV
jgi:assimilatory nitrate reductase catalytic subunit